MNDRQLSAPQRLIVALLYIATLTGIIRFFSGNWQFLQGSSPFGLIFVSAALLLIFGTYLTEPYFTKPADTITNCAAIILALISVKDKANFVAYNYFMTLAILFLIFGVVTVIFSNDPRPKWQRAIYAIVTKLGSSKIAFTAMYILTLVSFFTENAAEFWVLLSFLILLLAKFVFEDIVLWLTRLLHMLRSGDSTIDLLGEAIGKENPFLFKVEVDTSKRHVRGTRRGGLVYLKSGSHSGFLGVIANEKSLLNTRWLTVYLLQSSGKAINLDLNSNTITHSENIYSPNNLVYSLDINSLPDEIADPIREDKLFKNSERIVGYVAPGSNINKVKFETLADASNNEYLLHEGTILEIDIDKSQCLYQVIDAQTDEENLEKHNSTGFTIGIAQKLGSYSTSKRELNVVKWLPEMYAPVYFCNNDDKPTKGVNSIGLLPGTKFEIDIKEPDSLVTHNTAILGILGIGKSVLTFELLQKVLSSTKSKVICFDITNEYKAQLPKYTSEAIIADDQNAFNSINSKFDYVHTENGKSDFTKSGNVDEYRTSVQKSLIEFFFGGTTIPEDGKMSADSRIRIFNPDYHKVSKGEKVGFNVITVELTQAEKVRIISEESFRILMTIGVESELKARLLLVFEEAHSLIPEWNSTANEGDKTAVNGTAKVILQGRKYGLGSFLVTQRTANISKSILNQCNTIFALRVFDDTGKQFLENYVGADYANALPTLEERHSVAVGKALMLKQPVILRLNNMEDIVIKAKQENAKK